MAREDVVRRDVDEQDRAAARGLCEVTGGGDIDGTGTARIGITLIRETVGSTLMSCVRGKRPTRQDYSKKEADDTYSEPLPAVFDHH